MVAVLTVAVLVLYVLLPPVTLSSAFHLASAQVLQVAVAQVLQAQVIVVVGSGSGLSAGGKFGIFVLVLFLVAGMVAGLYVFDQKRKGNEVTWSAFAANFKCKKAQVSGQVDNLAKASGTENQKCINIAEPGVKEEELNDAAASLRANDSQREGIADGAKVFVTVSTTVNTDGSVIVEKITEKGSATVKEVTHYPNQETAAEAGVANV